MVIKFIKWELISKLKRNTNNLIFIKNISIRKLLSLYIFINFIKSIFIYYITFKILSNNYSNTNILYLDVLFKYLISNKYVLLFIFLIYFILEIKNIATKSYNVVSENKFVPWLTVNTNLDSKQINKALINSNIIYYGLPITFTIVSVFIAIMKYNNMNLWQVIPVSILGIAIFYINTLLITTFYKINSENLKLGNILSLFANITCNALFFLLH